MADVVKAACVQMNAGTAIEENLKNAEAMIREAAGKGAQFVATPENTDRILLQPEDKLKTALEEEDHPGLPHFSALAKELGIWLLIGSMGVKSPNGKVFNRSYLFDPSGKIKATYDKIHLFDVDLPGGESYRESDVIEPGNKMAVVKAPWGTIGMSICYDLRFPQLYRNLAKKGADILCVPAAFTVPTGQAHWEVLLRARAIENGAFVIAPAQVGQHEKGRKTWGHSMLIGPWGDVLAVKEKGPGIVMADLNMEEVKKVRSSIPSLQHDREFS